MPRIPPETIEEIRRHADIVELVGQVTPVQQRGRDFWACCPFHHEKTPSFKINPERQSYYCFGCKKSGNAISFVMDMVNTDFVGAIRWLGDRLGIEIPEDNGPAGPASSVRRQWKDTCYKLLSDAAGWFHENLRRPEAQAAVKYLASRELDTAAVNHFLLGYAPDGWDTLITWAKKQGYSEDQLAAVGLVTVKEDGKRPYDRFRNRLTFPIWDELGRVVGFSARVLEANPEAAKYVNTSETDFFHKSEILYAYHFARSAFKKHNRALVCEGQLDVIACHRAGLDCAIASQGTAFTEHHARMLKRSTQNVTLAFDADGAGHKATIRTVAILHGQGLAVDVATLPSGEDPDSIFRHGGAPALTAIMGATTPALPYLLQCFRSNVDLTRPENISDIARQLLEAIRPIPDPVAKAGHCQWLARELNLPENVILQELKLVDDGHPDPQRNAFQPLQTPQQARRALPAFQLPVENESALQCLLALLLRFEELARQLAADTDTTALIPQNTPLGEAIFTVLACVDQGEWEEAENQIASSQLAQTPAIGKVLVQNDFSALLPAPNDSDEQAERKREQSAKAYNDCLDQLLRGDLSRQIAQIRAQLTTAAPELKPELQKRLFELVTRKQQLGRR